MANITIRCSVSTSQSVWYTAYSIHHHTSVYALIVQDAFVHILFIISSTSKQLMCEQKDSNAELYK